jgi:dTDP-4-amino-4,6-dideoxygalactose transaminase
MSKCKIPYKRPEDMIDQEMKDTVIKILEEGHTSLGKEGYKLEQEFADFCGAKYAVSISSGSAALHLAIIACKIHVGDEVITVPNSFTSTADCIVHVGAKPVFVDVEKDTYNINTNEIEKNVNQKTKAIIVVHMNGHPADMDPILEIAEKYNLYIIEDACHALGAEYKGTKTGNLGHIAAFSFSAKGMYTGPDSGMLVTNDKEIRDDVMARRYCGQLGIGRDRSHAIHEIGFNYGMSEIASAIARIQLRKVEKWCKVFRHHARIYSEMLENVPYTVRPVEKDWAYHVFLRYYIRVKKKRDKLIQFLRRNGVGTNIQYVPPIHLQKPYMELYGYKRGDFPITEREKEECLALPQFLTLEREDIEFVVSKIKEFYKLTS